jgi:UDP-N-acetylglucosamine acyltransferase
MNPTTGTRLIHPTAVISPEASLAPDVQVGPYAVIEGPVQLGTGCRVRAHAHLLGPLTAGEMNDFGSHCVIGERPQHLGYQDESTSVLIGNRNTFREHVTIHRGMPNARKTTLIGNDNFFMVASHVAHDCIVGNNTIFVNSALVGGHCEIGDRVLLSGNCGIHQFVRIGRLALVRGLATVSQDIPPFWVVQSLNFAITVNVVGMRRSGMPSEDIQAVRLAFRMIYRKGMMLQQALTAIEAEFGARPAIQELLKFIRESKRGIPGAHRYQTESSEARAA